MPDYSRMPINYNPFDDNFVSYLQGAIKKALYDFHTCIPAIVKKVIDRKTVIVSPAVQQIDSKHEPVAWADIKLPVHTPCGNAIVISAPLTVGDTGWIIAGDLDPSLFLKDTSKPAKQNVLDRHDYRFGFFMPDKITGYEISSDDDGGLYIGNLDGTTKLVIKDDSITLLGKTDLKISAESITINTEDNASVVIDGVNFKDHQHGLNITTASGVVANLSTGAVSTTQTIKTEGVE